MARQVLMTANDSQFLWQLSSIHELVCECGIYEDINA